MDLPGTYSLGAFSEDEVVAREYIMSGEADVVIDVVDATNLRRNLYLTLQLLEAGADVVLALNMMDEVQRYNMEIDPKKLSSTLGVPVISTIASKCVGMEDIIEATIKLSGRNRKEKFAIDYGQELESHIEISDIYRTRCKTEDRLSFSVALYKLLREMRDSSRAK